MDKPISLKIEEFKEQLVDLINSSGLPCWLLESPIKEMMEEVKTVAKKQREIDRENYEKSLVEKS